MTTTAMHHEEAEESAAPGRSLTSLPWRRWGGNLLPAAALIVVQQIFFPVPSGVVLQGVLVGGLTALVALGMALIYRSNRILNFAQADLGGLPTIFVILLITSSGWSYFVALPIGIVGSVVLGAVVELAIIRRFFRAPRLILTVATIGLAQLLAAGAILLPRAWDERLISPRIDAPFSADFTFGGVVFGANDLIAMVVAPVAIIALAWFLQRTDVGVAIRASAGSADRAVLLGVPVHRLQTVVWAIAGGLAFVATFLRAGILGFPTGFGFSLALLLRALAALMLGRLTNLTTITTVAVALGVLELGIPPNTSSPLLIDPILAVVVGIALIVQRRSAARVDQGEASSWQAAEEVRPIPDRLLRVPEVRWVRWAGAAALLIFALALPNFLGVADQLKASAVLIYGILVLSLVVLTGWAGQLSLGQVAFFAVGAVVGIKASVNWNLDLSLALILASLVGAAVAVVVGLPALRSRGLFLAVATLAFALATTSYLLNRRFFDWVPSSLDRIDDPKVLGFISLQSEVSLYYACLVALVLVVLALRGVRRSRTGRVLIALRENERAVQAYGVSVARAKLSAFALSGAVAAFAGCLFAFHQKTFGVEPYTPFQNFAVFTMAVIGGIASVPGAVLGALYLNSTQWFLPSDWRFLATGGGVLFVLLFIPSGLGGVVYRIRDLWLRSVARRHDLEVPDELAEGHHVKGEGDAQDSIVHEAAAALESVDDRGADGESEERPAVASAGTGGSRP